jgi:ABC-type cobalamin/Fe3+-siderophores transport system ATPase subunit
MIVKEVEPMNFGPFTQNAKLSVDPQVTVITGPNDVGKSCLLRLIRDLCRRTKIEERDYNRSREGEFPGPWERDPEVGAKFLFELTDRPRDYFFDQFRSSVNTGDQIRVYLRTANTAGAIDCLDYIQGGSSTKKKLQLQKLPSIVWAPADSEVKDIIDLMNMTASEQRLIRPPITSRSAPPRGYASR